MRQSFIHSFSMLLCAIFITSMFNASATLNTTAMAADKDKKTKKVAAKKVVFVAGRRSHGNGAHEHNAGCMLLAKALQKTMPNFKVEVVRNGWPKDASVFDGADAIIMYCDGGGGHIVNPHLKQMDAMMKKGIGVACIHYAVETTKGKSGDYFLDWMGGYFEPHWSVNPHWKADFKKFPKHPITRGIKPFAIQDEWYYHMRFRKQMKNVTPILSADPPKSTLRRRDGAHSGNPAVRKAVADGKIQHVAWAATRADGGRGFGFTGGHFHNNWGDDNFRRLMLNAIVWVAKAEVPKNGVEDKTPTKEDLKANQDHLQSSKKKKRSALPKKVKKKASFASKTITPKTPNHSVNIDIDIKGAKKLYLVATDAGDGHSCDWVAWANPQLIGPTVKKKLTDLKWKSATTGHGQVRINQNAGGAPLKIAGKKVEYGIGAHANSVIAYDIPQGFTRFKVTAGLDNGGTDQSGCGNKVSVKFLIFLDHFPKRILQASSSNQSGSHDPQEAVENLDVHPELQTKLFAAEPKIVSLTNLAIDHRGRVWVCEVMNYRRNNGRRPAGDRILILEDTNQDGIADKQKVYYQGRDIDSAMGICILGNKVIISASPNVIVFTDTDGDDKPDKKELLFTKTGQQQHDHSAHSFVFGPDGKLYWNFGNMGGSVHDKNGKLVVDVTGNKVVANGKPYYGGMIFRCNLDGSEFEVLAHNFRNNYEVAIDSFGNLWQSDNDDDGNRGVRINYILEHGNYGYLDELNGSGWRTSRIGMHSEVPKKHWHLNDPGVVPNLLQTGAGSPTGITVYEGRLLPKAFWNNPIHCDAGPNIVRAYQVKKDGAGYSAKSLDILKGTRDRWFRPADVAVAPDGSIFVSDWYDPGVGGHAQGDLDRGRLFWIAPKGHKYRIPKYDFKTAAGAIEALKSPNQDARYLAWTALHKMGKKAASELLIIIGDSKEPQYRARALWLLAKIDGFQTRVMNLALRDNDPNIRIVGVRLLHLLKLDPTEYFQYMLNEESPQVLRQYAIALRHTKNKKSALFLAKLATKHKAGDRWYLEAIGIGAEKQWDAVLDAWLTKFVGNSWNRPAGREIIWRSRAAETSSYLAEIILDPTTKIEELPRYFRALQFQATEPRNAALLKLAFTNTIKDQKRQQIIATTSLKLLKGFNLRQNPQYIKTLDKLLSSQKGTLLFVELIDQFQHASRYPELLEIAQKQPQTQLGILAVRVLLNRKQSQLIRSALKNKNQELAVNTAQVLGNSSDARAVALLKPIIDDESFPLNVKRSATISLAKIYPGAKFLIQRIKAGKIDDSVRSAAAIPLSAAKWKDIHTAAAKLFPSPDSKNNETLPPLAKLLKIRGNSAAGQKVFAGVGTCAKCHQVNNVGKNVGPDLSVIGAKLSRHAMFESILYPSAGISHNYEAYRLDLDDGNVVIGLLMSQTADSVSIKADDAIVRSYKKSEIERMKKIKISFMPKDLQKSMTAAELVNVVEYMTTLKKAKKK